MADTIGFDASKARRYRKRALVYAFRSNDPFEFEKTWGSPRLPAGSYLIVPLDGGRTSGDLYGVDVREFERTYEEAGPGTYRKVATIEAYQPGHDFRFVTKIREHVEVADGAGRKTDWFVRNPSGETYVVDEVTFSRTYELV